MLVGLGNPGKKYEGSRHNIGFRVVDQVARQLGLTGWKERFDAEILQGHAADGAYLLVKPQTFMNLSGRSVGALARYHRVEPESCLVVVDDLDLDLGRVRVRESGGHGGHNGLRSLIEHMGGEAFKRIRIGIGRPQEGRSVTGHVLAAYAPEEAEKLDRAMEEAAGLASGFLESAQFENWTSA